MKNRLISRIIAITMLLMITSVGMIEANAASWLWPVTNGKLGTPFSDAHGGIDINDVPAGTPVMAAASGTVTCVNDYQTAPNDKCPICDATGGGKHVEISHGGNIYSSYSHLSGTNVSLGSTVTQGQIIGYIGDTGNSYGPHLHFAISYATGGHLWWQCTLKNPLDYVSPTGQTSAIVLTNTGASNISNNNAKISAKLSPLSYVTTCGFYIGNSENSLAKVTETVNTNVEHIWYDLVEYGKTLSPGTTYFYKLYTVVNGVECQSAISSFTTTGQTSAIVLTNTGASNISNINAKISAKLPSLSYVTTCGFYIGNSENSLAKVTETVNTNVEYIWYDLVEYGKTLSPGTTYYYKLYTVVNGVECQSSISSFTTTGQIIVPKPGAPTLIVPESNKSSENVLFSWAVTSDTTQYDLRIFQNGVNIKTEFSIIGTNYSIKLPAGSYSAFLCSVNANYPEWWTKGNEVKFSVKTADYIPEKTVAPTIKATSRTNSIKIIWNKDTNSGNIGYNLYRATSSGGYSSTPLTDFVITDTTYTDLNVKSGKTYYYILKSVYNDNNIGAASNEVSATLSGSIAGKNTIVLQIGNAYMEVNGARKEIDPGKGTMPILHFGRTVLPIRAVVEAIGGIIGWDGNESKVTITARGTVVELWIDSNTISVNGINKEIDVAPTVINDRTMVPIRFVTENLNCTLNWDETSQRVTINY